MKAKLFLSLFLSFTFYVLSSQIPQGFNYQAIARDGSGNPIIGSAIKVKLSILSDTSGFYANGAGIYIWEEEQTNVRTNAFGLFTVVLGNPSATKVQGSASSFSAIDWAKTPLYIGTKIANPTSYKNMGSARLWSVPYSMAADSSKALLKGSKLTVVSSDDLTTDALFEVKRKDGQTVFAVYPNAVNIYVPRTAKGTKGGFAIGGFDGSKIAPQDYFRVTPDSVRVYIDKTPVIGKGTTKGGFAIGGFDQVKGGTQDFFTVANDSIRMYVNSNPLKGTKGGFAIGGFGLAKGASSYFMNMTPNNYFIGEKSGQLTTGLYNSFFGFETGILPSTGAKNIFIGYHSGMNNGNDSSNVFLGNETGLSNQGNFNTFLGFQSGYSNTTGGSNCFIGKMSGKLNTNGTNNVFIGFESGYNNTGGTSAFQGSNNTFIGSNVGHQNTTGWSNVFIGTGAGHNTIDGYRNVFLGVNAGYENLNGTDNIYFGNDAGHYNTAGNANIFLGAVAGYHNQTGSENIFFGTWSGGFNTSGSNNICIGRQTGMQNNGSDNVYIGPLAGMYNTVGINNLFLGSSAGGVNSGGSGNVFLGYHAGYNETGSNKLYIANSDVDSTLIYGNFSSKIVGIGTSHPLAKFEVAVSGTNGYSGMGIRSSLSGGKLITLNQGLAGKLNFTEPGVNDLVTFDFNTSKVGILNTSPTYTFQVNGSVAGTSAYANLSDLRYKKDVEPIAEALKKILALQGITFNWDKTADPELNVDDNNHFGFAAQDIERILPQVVITASDKMQTKSVAYGDVVPVLVEAIKEQQQQIESAKLENQKLKTELDELKSLVNDLIVNKTSKGNN